MAEIWLGTDLSLTRQVAIKVLKPTLASDPVVAERFRREAISVAQLSHPNIVAVYDAIEDNGRQAVVMQLVNGKSLRQLLDEQKRLSPDLTMHIGTCVAAALDAAHRAGMVHRDVKPGNILITPDGRVMLTDFGIAKGLEPTGDDLTSDNIMMGTAKYLSPEQVRGKRLDGRADLYSLGLVLYECLAGRVPFLGQTDADTALARLQRDPTDITRLRPTLPHGLASVIHKLLARRPDDRYPTGAALKAALGEVTARAHDLTGNDQTGGRGADRTPAVQESPRSAGRLPAGVGSPRGSAPARAPAAVGGYQPVRTTGRPAGVPARVTTDRDRTPTGRNRVQQRPNREFEHRRSPSLVVVGGLLLAALVVSMLLWNTLGRDTGPTTDLTGDATDETAAAGTDAPAPSAGSATIAAVSAYDPDGDGTEHNEEAPLVLDGDPNTAWSTQCYSSEYFGTKGGVGLTVTLDHAATGTLRVDISSAPWIMEVYGVADETLPPGIYDWGESLLEDYALETDSVSVEVTSPAKHLLILLRQGARTPTCSAEFPFNATVSEIGFEATS
jgi:serine/threonine-protein kinase